MNIKDLEYHKIEDIRGFVTNIETQKTPQSYARSMLGMRNLVVDKVAERDFGTKHALSTYAALTGTIRGGTIINDPDTGLSHTALATVDGSDVLRVYVDETGGSTDVDAGTGSTSWLELTQTHTTTIASIDAATLLTLTASPSGVSNLSGWLIHNETVGTHAMISAGPSTNQITILGDTGVGKLNWTSTDTVTLYRCVRRFISWDTTIGTLAAPPVINWIPTEVQRKALLLLSDTTATANKIPVAERPSLIRRFDARERFFSASSALWTIPAGWDMYLGGGFDFTFNNLGYTPGYGLLVTAIGTQTASGLVKDSHGNAFLNIYATASGYSTTGASVPNMMKAYITLVMDGYQESDPVATIYIDTATTNITPQVNFRFDIDPAVMPRNLTGINIYYSDWYPALAGWQDPAYLTWAESQDTAYLVDQISLTEQNYDDDGTTARNWSLANNDDERTMSFTTVTHTYARTKTRGLSVRAALGRDSVLENKGYVSARYGAKSRRGQGAAIALDNGDDEVRLTCIDGYGVHNDDNFPEVSQDINLTWHKVALSGRGRVLGLGLHNDILYVFRESEIEMYDVQSGVSRFLPIDIVAPRSILQLPWGLVWAGRSAIYFLEYGDLTPQPLSSDWTNYYDGTLIDTGVAPKVTDAARKAILTGFDQTYQELLVQIAVNESGTQVYRTFRYNFPRKAWNVREWNFSASAEAPAGRVDFFERWGDNRLVMGFGYSTATAENGVVVYPFRGSSLARSHQDAVPYTPAAGRGVKFELIVNVASVESLIREAVLEGVLIDQYGSVSNSRTLRMDTLTNEGTITRDTKYFPILTKGTKPTLRRMPLIGPTEDMQLKFYFDNSNLTDYNEFNIDSIYLGLKRRDRIGNN